MLWETWIRYLLQIYLRNFFYNFAKISVFQQEVSIVYSDNRLFYQSKNITESSKSLTIEFWQSLNCQNSHWADLIDWYLCNVPTKRFISWVFLTVPRQRRYTKDIFFEMLLRGLKDVTKKTSLLRCLWEVSEISLSMEIWLRSLRDISCRLGIFYFLLHCVPSVTIKSSIYNLISQSRKESLRPAICYHHIPLYLIQEYEAN